MEQLPHPHICPILDAFAANGVFSIVMADCGHDLTKHPYRHSLRVHALVRMHLSAGREGGQGTTRPVRVARRLPEEFSPTAHPLGRGLPGRDSVLVVSGEECVKFGRRIGTVVSGSGLPLADVVDVLFGCSVREVFRSSASLLGALRESVSSGFCQAGPGAKRSDRQHRQALVGREALVHHTAGHIAGPCTHALAMRRPLRH